MVSLAEVSGFLVGVTMKNNTTSCENGYSKECDASTNTTENTFIEDGYLKIQPIYWNTNYGQTPFDDPYCVLMIVVHGEEHLTIHQAN